MFRRKKLRNAAQFNRKQKAGRRKRLNPNFERLEARQMLTTFVDITDVVPDGGGCGSFANPCGDIGTGVANAPAGGEVYVAAGAYTETVTIAKNLHLRGEAGAVTITGGAFNGIDIVGVVNVKIEDIKVTGSDNGIFAPGAGVLEFQDVEASMNAKDGVTVLGATSVTIEGGDYSANTLNGITLDTIAGDVVVIDSDSGGAPPAAFANAVGNGGSGLDVRIAGSVTVLRGKFDGNGIDGIQLTDVGLGGIEIYDVDAKTNASDGIEIGDSLGVISIDLSDLSANTASGLNVNNMAAGDLLLRDVLATGNGSKGTAIADVASVFDTNGLYEDNGSGGMQMLDVVGSVTLYNTTATDNETIGIEVAPDLAPVGASSLAILGGYFADTDGTGLAKTQDTGIYALEIAGDVDLTKSFGVFGSEVLVTGHAGDGVLLEGGGRVEIEGGVFDANLNGVRVFGYGEIDVEDATATSNADDGIAVVGGGMATVTGGTYDSNGLGGLYFDALGMITVRVGSGLTANLNGDDGLFAVGFGDLMVEGGSFSDNSDNGLELTLGVNAFLSRGVTASGNGTGVYAHDLLEGFFDNAGVYSSNVGDGILLEDIGGVAVLTNTTATDNDSNSNGIGDGLHVEKGVSPAGVGSDLIVEGGMFTGQERGIFASDVMGAVFMVPAAPGADLVATGNSDNGALIEDSGPVFALGGDYSSNGTEGLRIASVPGVMIESVTSSFNGDDGVELDFFGDAMIANVTATNNVFDGMNLGGGFDVHVDGGTFDENGDNGISVSLAGDVVIANTSMNLVGVPALFPLNAGIYILDNSSVVLENNSVTNSDRIGVDIELTPNVTLVTTEGNVSDAVAVEAGTISHIRAAGTVDELILDNIEYSGVSSLTIDTVDSDDAITVQLGTALPPLDIVGGEQGYSDTLTIIRDEPSDTVTVTPTTIADGTSTITYSEIEKVVVDDGDFNFDSGLGTSDIDALVEDIYEGNNTPQYELTGDNKVDHDDLVRWLELGGAANLSSGNSYLFGDANLDGVVDGADFLAWNSSKFSSDALWSGGDFNADGETDGLDFLVWNGNKFMDANAGDLQEDSTPATLPHRETAAEADAAFAPRQLRAQRAGLAKTVDRTLASPGSDRTEVDVIDLVFAESLLV